MREIEWNTETNIKWRDFEPKNVRKELTNKQIPLIGKIEKEWSPSDVLKYKKDV